MRGERTFLGEVLQELSRRRFLQGTGALLVTACGRTASRSPDAGADAGADGGDAGADADAGTAPQLLAFRAWSEIRDAVRLSPDHLAAAADRVIAGKDPAQIFAFVRDRIATIPASSTELGSSEVRAFGLRGTLRAGAGTLRDKAELLVDLYTRAGLTAHVVEGTPTATTDFVKTVLTRTVDRTFDPPVTDEQLTRWRSWLDIPTEPVLPTPLDPDGTQAAALAATLGALLPATLDLAEAFDFTPPLSIPLVSVTVGGAVTYANVALPATTFGDSGVVGTPQAASDAAAFPNVQLTLSVVTSADPSTPVDVVTAAWSVEDVVGRSLFVSMVPPEDLVTLLGRKLGDIRAFVPVLAVRAPGMTAAEQDALTAAGSALTLSGEIIDVSGDQLTIHGAVLDTTPLDPAKLASVTALALTVDAGHFPEIRVRATALDAAGSTVPGLPASAFTLDEEMAPEVFTMLENRAPPPRVLFLLDKSDSVPAAFGGANGAALVQDIATQMLVDEPACTFRVLPIGGNKRMGAWTADPAVLSASAVAQMGFGSDLWAAVADASTLDATVMVMITDGQTTDAPSPKILAALSLAPSTVLVGVGAGPSTTLDAMAVVLSGTVVPSASPTDAATGAVTFVREQQKSDYLFRYQAPVDGPTDRHVALGLPGGAVSGSGAYTVPAPEQRNPPAQIDGLLLTVKVGSEAPFVRVLAGAREIPSPAPASLFDDVQAAFFGCTEVRFERAPPTQAAILDDILTTQLDREPLVQAALANDTAAFLDATLKQPPPYSLATVALHQALPGGVDPLTFATGLRAVALTSAPRFGPSMRQRVDMLPAGPYRTADPDAKTAFSTTMARTAWLALAEDAMSTTSTRKSLAGQALALVAPFAGFDTALTAAPAAVVAAFDLASLDLTAGYRLAPTSGAPVAFWNIDTRTGALLGVLDGGAGGGEAEPSFECAIDISLTFFQMLGDLASFAGLMGTMAGLWLQLEITKARKLLGATIVIAGGMPSSATGDPTDLSPLAMAPLCAAANGALGWGAGALAGNPGIVGAAAITWLAARRANSLIGLATGGSGSLYSACPSAPSGGMCP